MQNFTYQNNTKIVFGRDILKNIGPEVAKYFGKKVLLVTGVNSFKHGSYYKNLIGNLEDNACVIDELSGVSPNPKLSDVETGVSLCKKHRIEVVIAAGGGSVIDAAKAVGAGAVVDHHVWKFFTGKKSVKSSLPVLVFPTLAGAGSETSSGMVLSHPEKKQKLGIANRNLYPKTAFLDPEATFTAPISQTCFGAVDTISHLLEVYFSHQEENSSIQEDIIEGLIIAVINDTLAVVKDPENYKSRANLLWISSLALNGLTYSGLGRIAFEMHLLEHTLSALCDCPHGKGLSSLLVSWLKKHEHENAIRADKLFKRLQAGNINIAGSFSTLSELFKTWLIILECPTSIYNLDENLPDIKQLATHCHDQARYYRMRHLTLEYIETRYKLASVV